MNGSSSKLTWSLLGTIVSLIGVLSSWILLAGYQPEYVGGEWKTGVDIHVATSPPMSMKEIENQLKLDKRLQPFLENRESPLLLTVLQWMLPVSFISLIMFGWIYLRTYRAQFQD